MDIEILNERLTVSKNINTKSNKTCAHDFTSIFNNY